MLGHNSKVGDVNLIVLVDVRSAAPLKGAASGTEPMLCKNRKVGKAYIAAAIYVSPDTLSSLGPHNLHWNCKIVRVRV